MVEDDKGRFYKCLLNLLVHWDCIQDLGNTCMLGQECSSISGLECS